MEYRIGMACGLFLGLLAGVGLVALLFKKKVLDMYFDERQERVRGVAYKYGFVALAVSIFAYGILETLLGRWCDTLVGCTLCVCLAMVVFAVVCIRKDAYLSLYEKPKSVMVTFAVISVVNLLIGLTDGLQGQLVADGVLTFHAVNPICGVMLLVVLAVYAARCRSLGHGAGEEEE